MKTEKPIPDALQNIFLNQMQETARKVIQSGEQHQPVVVALRLDDDLKIINSSLIVIKHEGRLDTKQIGARINGMLASRDYDMIAFIDEVWHAHVKSLKDRPKDLSTHPDADEAVMIIIYTRQGERMSINPITQNPRKMHAREFKVWDAADISGNLSIHSGGDLPQ